MQRFESLKGKALALLLFFWFLWFTNFMCRTIFSPILPLLEDEFAVTHARATSIIMCVGAGNALSVFFSGVYASILGLKKSILISIVVLGVTFALIPLTNTFSVLYAITFAMGIAAGMYLPAAIPLLTTYYPERMWGKVLASHDSASSLCILATPLAVVFFLSFFAWRGIFLMVAIVLFACGAVFYFIAEDVKVGAQKRYVSWGLLKRKSFWLIGLVWAFTAGAYMGVYYITPLYFSKELSLSVDYANTISGISRIGACLVVVSAGFLVDRFSLKKMVFFLVLINGILTSLVAVRDIRWAVVFLFLQASVGAGFFPLGFVSLSRLFEPELRGQALGFVITLGTIGTSVAPYLLGISGDLISFRFGILLLGIAAALSSGLLYFLKELR